MHMVASAVATSVTTGVVGGVQYAFTCVGRAEPTWHLLCRFSELELNSEVCHSCKNLKSLVFVRQPVEAAAVLFSWTTSRNTVS